MLALLGGLLLLTGGSVTATAVQPRECKARSDAPYLPIYHIVGNITHQDPNKPGSFETEAINDVSAIFMHMGVWHVFHQCCQNHWDHVVSLDGIHWRRLPPPVRPSTDPAEWYDARGSYDGSISLLPESEGGIVMLYDAMHNGTGPPNGSLAVGDDEGWLAVARPKNSSDPFLEVWSKSERNPVWFDAGEDGTGQVGGAVFPSGIWKSGDHWNFLSKGDRFFTKDPSFANWTRWRGADPETEVFMREGSGGTGEAGRGEEGGQWFVKLPNTTEGKPPPAGSPTHAANIFVGNQFALGDYDEMNESWTLRKIDHRIDTGPTDGWSAASYAGDRLMNMGWAPRGRTPGGSGRMMNQNDQLTIMRDVRWEPRLQTLVANPIEELALLRNGTLAHEGEIRAR